MKRTNILKTIFILLCLAPLALFFNKTQVKAEDNIEEEIAEIYTKELDAGETIVNSKDSFLAFAEASKSSSFAGSTVVFTSEEIITIGADDGFTGIGSASTPFEGTFSITKFDLVNNSGVSLFANLSTSASFTGSTMGIDVSNNKPLADKLTVVAGSTLDLSHFTFKSGSTLAINGSGLVANTLSGTGALSFNFGSMLSSVSSVTFSNATDAGLISGILPAGITLSISGVTTPTLTGSYGMNVGGVVGTCNGIINVTGTNTFKTSSGNYNGGICGVLNGTVTMTGTTTVNASNAVNGGGITAKTVSGSDITVTSLTLNSTISGNSNGTVGGVVGENDTTISLNGITLSTTISNSKYSGGFIGQSLENSYMKGNTTATATVTIDGAWQGYAGGVIADATKGKNTLNVDFTSGSEIQCQGIAGGIYGIYSDENSADMLTPTYNTGNLSLSGSKIIGGYIGKAIITKNTELTDEKFNTSLKKGWLNETYELGVFIGSLDVRADFTFAITKEYTVSGFGMFGSITSSSKANTVLIQGNISKLFTTSGIKSDKQGVIISQIEANTYVRINNLYTQNNDGDAAQVVNIVSSGMLDVGNINYQNSSGSTLVLTQANNTVVRLYGTLTTGNCKYIVKELNNSIIYTEDTFSLTRTSLTGWDVGNRNGIIKNAKAADGTDIITFNSTNHTISIHSLKYTSGTITLSEVADAVIMAITIQTNGNFHPSNATVSQVLSANINLTKDIDLTNAGIESLGNTTTLSGYSGTFNGNGHKITMYIGIDVKGNKKARVYNSDNVYLGLFTKLESATFKDLTIDGTINVSTGTTFSIGSFSSTASTATFTNCTSLLNVTLTGGSTIKIGGYVGIANNTITLTDCKTGTETSPVVISSTNGALIGGVIGLLSGGTLNVNKSTGTSAFYTKITNVANTAGIIAQVTGQSNVSIQNSTISTNINSKYTTAGVLGSAESSNGTSITIKNNTITSEIKVTASGSIASGVIGSLPVPSGTSNSLTKVEVSNNTIKTTINSSEDAAGVLCIINKSTNLSELHIIDNTIKDCTINSNGYAGMLIAHAESCKVTTIDLTNNTITNSNVTSTSSNGYAGGLTGVITLNSLRTIDISGTTITGSLTTNSVGSSVASGGLLGHQWSNTEVRVSGTNAFNITSSGLCGGLFGIYDGILIIEEDFKNTGKLKTTSSGIATLIVSEASTDYESMIFVKTSLANLMGTIEATKYELANYVITKDDATETAGKIITRGGLLSIETGGTLGSLAGVMDGAWGTYFTNLSANHNVRYYFNTYGYFYNASGSYQKSLTTISSASDLVYWHLRDYLFDNNLFYSGVKEKFYSSAVDNLTLSSQLNIDLTDYCLYPTNKMSSTLDFKNSSITFGLSNATLKSKVEIDGQFYGLQFGFLIGASATSSTKTNITIKDVKLLGEFYSDSKYSGVLIVDTFSGYHTSTATKKSELKLTNITLAGIKNVDYDNPLLIKAIGEELTMVVEGISAYNNTTSQSYVGHCYYSTKAASALFGDTGSETAVDLNITLKEIAVDNCMFKTALFFTSMLYSAGSKVTYDFSQTEDFLNGIHIKNVTYGGEIDFEDQDCYLNSEVYVNPTGSNAAYDFEANYLYYCGTSSESAYMFLFYVNRKKSNLDIETGFGTYEHPYIINNGGQLIVLADILTSGEIPEGFIINFPSNTSTPTKYGKYTYENNAFTLNSGTANSSISAELIREWLQGAYFSIEPLNAEYEINLTATKFENFVGIGTIYYPFHGVIVGKTKDSKTPNIKMPENIKVNNTSFTSEVHSAGLISVSNGCAIHNLTITYKNIKYTGEKDISKNSNFVSMKKTSTDRGTDYSSFGGVIGLHIGGDASISASHVVFNDTTITSSSAVSVFGGLVGYVYAGGVILDETSGVNQNSDFVYSTALGSRVHFNTYVGKVLSAFVVSINSSTSIVTTSKYSNKNLIDSTYIGYQIASIRNLTNASIISSTGNSKITISNAEQLLILAMLSNSGYLGNDKKIYQTNLVRSRFGSYDGVGGSTGVTNGLYSQDTYTASSIPYLLRYFSTAMTYNPSMEITFAEKTLIDMSPYGNAFRGIGTVKRANSIGDTRVVTINGQNAKIKMDIDIRQYSVTTSYEKDSLEYIGLVTWSDCSKTYKNLTFYGSIKVRFINADGGVIRNRFGTISIGALAGYANYLIADNICIGTKDNAMYVEGPSITGGMIGQLSTGANATNDKKISNCTVENSNIICNCISGGLIGKMTTNGNATNLRTYVVTDCVVKNSNIIASNNIGQGNLFAGGIVGQTEGNDYGTNNINNVEIVDSNVMIYAIADGDCFVGGIVGYQYTGLLSITNSKVQSTNVSGIGVLITGYYICNSTTTVDVSNVNNIVAAAYNYVISGEKDNYGKVTSGGVVGRTMFDISIENTEVVADNKEMYIIGYNNASGFIGEVKYRTVKVNDVTTPVLFYNVGISDSKVSASKFNINISGITRAAGAIGYYDSPEDSKEHKTTLSNVTIEGVKAENTNIYIISTYKKNTANTSSSGFVGGTKNASVELIDSTIRECILMGRNASIVTGYQDTKGNISVSGLTVDSCYLYGTEKVAIISSYFSSKIDVNNIHVANTTITGGTNCTGSILTGTAHQAEISGGNLIFHNISIGASSIDFGTTTATFIYQKIIELTKNQNSGYSGLFGKTTISTSNKYNYLGYSSTGKVRLYNVVRSELSTTPATPTTIKDFSSNCSNNVVVYLDYSVYNPESVDSSFGFYKEFASADFDVSKLDDYKDDSNNDVVGLINSFGHIADTDDGAVRGEPNATTTYTDTPLTAQYLNQDSVSEYAMTTEAISILQFKNIEGLSFSASEAYKLAGILSIESTIDSINSDLVQYLDLITNGGFSKQLQLEAGNLAISSYRYKYENGTVTKIAGKTGSIIFSGSQFVFNSDETTGGYDLLSGGDNLSFTIIYITYEYGEFSYTMSVILYYEQILKMDSHVVPVIGENYLISSYLGNKESVKLDPTQRLSLYIEYAYSDVAERINFNFEKKLVSVTNYGLEENATSIPAGTKFKLIDISSATPSGYKVYYYELDDASNVIYFSSFVEEGTIDYIALTALSQFDTITTNSDFIYVERYIMVVEFPSNAVSTELSYFFAAKETTRNNVRIEHEVIGNNISTYTHNVKLMGAPYAELETDHTSDPDLALTFSNLSDDPLDAVITGTITLPKDYYQLVVNNQNLYGIYRFTLVDSDNNVITLPDGTACTITHGSTSATIDVSNLGSISYSIGDIISKASKKSSGDDYGYDQNVTMKLDFSGCGDTALHSVFTNGATYTLRSEFYLSTDEDQYNTGTKFVLDSLNYTANFVADIKVTMIPEDSRHLGINISSVEAEDTSNDGVIDFNLIADFSALGDNVPSEATLTFKLYRKGLVDGTYKYVEYSSGLPNGIITSLGSVYDGETALTDNTITLSVDQTEKKIEKELTYKIDFPKTTSDTIDKDKILQTSYKLQVSVSYQGDEKTYNTFFIFLIVDINTN